MRRSTFLHVAREGWPLILLVFMLAAFAHLYVHEMATLVLLGLGVVLVSYFHEPTRSVPSEPLAVVAPVDGVVTLCENVRDPWLDRDALHVKLKVGFLGAYMMRSPVEGTVLEVPADARKSQPGIASWIRTDEQDDVVMAIPAGSLLGASPLTVRYGERVGQGRRNGVRRLAREVELFMPANSRLEVETGQKVCAGKHVLATLVHKQNGSNGHSAEKSGD